MIQFNFYLKNHTKPPQKTPVQTRVVARRVWYRSCVVQVMCGTGHVWYRSCVVQVMTDETLHMSVCAARLLFNSIE